MANSLLLKTAALLECLADDFDARESQKVAAAASNRETLLKTLETKYASATGDDLPDEMRSSLAGYSEDQLKVAISLVEKKAASMDSLGGADDRPSENNDRPKNKKEAAQAAYDKFGAFLTR